MSNLDRKNEITQAISKGGYWIEFLEEEHKNNRDLWFEFLEEHENKGHHFQAYWPFAHLGEKLQNDIDFFKAVIKKIPEAYEYASEELKSNKKSVLEALSVNTDIVTFISKNLKNDPEIIAKAKSHDLGNPFIINTPAKTIQTGLDGAFKDNNNCLDLRIINFQNDAKRNILDNLKKIHAYNEKDHNSQMAEELEEGTMQYLELLDKPPFDSDREIALACVQANLRYSIDIDEWFENLSKELRSDKEIVLMALDRNYHCIEHVGEELLGDREVILQGINSCNDNDCDDYAEPGWAFSYASKALRADRSLLELALPVFGAALNYASKDLQLDIDLNKQAIKKSGRAHQYESTYSLESMPKEIQNNKEIILYALEHHVGIDTTKMPEAMLNDREIALAIIKAGSCRGFETLSSELRADFEVAKAAVQVDGKNLQHVSKTLKSDPEIVSTALHSTFGSVEFVSRDCEILSNKSEIMKILKKNHPGKDQNTGYLYWSKSCWSYADENSVFRHLDKKLREDKDIVLAALPYHCPVLSWTSKKLKDDREVVLAAIKHSGTRSELKHASKRLRDDNLVVKKAMKTRGDNLEFASKRVRSDKKMMQIAVLNHSGLKWVDASLLSNRSLILSAVRFDKLNRRSSTSNNHDGLCRISDKLKADREILYNSLLINTNGFTGFFCRTFMDFDKSKYRINNPLLKDKEFILSVIKANSGMLDVIATQEAFSDVWKDQKFLKKLSYIGSWQNYWADSEYVNMKRLLTIKNNPEMSAFFEQCISKQT